jgi:hypothetical protein
MSYAGKKLLETEQADERLEISKEISYERIAKDKIILYVVGGTSSFQSILE